MEILTHVFRKNIMNGANYENLIIYLKQANLNEPSEEKSWNIQINECHVIKIQFVPFALIADYMKLVRKI